MSLGALLLAGLGGCSGVISGGSPGGSGSSGSGNGGGVSAGKGGSNGNPGTGNSGTTTTGSGGSGAAQTITCAPGIPATTQLRRMLNTQYDATVRDLLGVTSVTTPEGAGVPSSVLYADFDGPMVPDAWRIYQDVGAAIAKQVMGSSTLKSNFITCDPAASGCLAQTIQTFGRKAFRRPLTADEVTRFQALGQGTPAGTPAEVAEATLFAFLVDPSFLYLVETNTTAAASPAPAGALQLSSYEVAARLSYMIWGSTPDSMLSAAADANQLQTKDQILAQAQRMVALKDKTAPQLSAFHDHWVQMDNSGQHWWHIDHDTKAFPLYSVAARPSYQGELDSFFAEVASTGTYKDLFLSNVGFVNKDNAAIYGLDPSKYGTTLTKVQLDPEQRPGFMTRVGFLSSYSHFSDTSPILRGAFIVIYMLGVNVPPPPPGAAMTPQPPGDYKTNREKVSALVQMTGSDCVACHTNIINPPGFVLENFNSIGQWQTTDQLGGPIDATATVNFGGGNSQAVTSVKQLMQGIADSAAGRATYAQYWVAYAYGRQPNPQDQCIADQIGTNLSTGNYPILNILSDLTQADSFRLRVRATP
ncbi:MAG TPA: DUF1592 domain-containing protein [Polyangia bacterium]|nr:DUF1592 domain-containing protein [Polyangia bacterium]